MPDAKLVEDIKTVLEQGEGEAVPGQGQTIVVGGQNYNVQESELNAAAWSDELSSLVRARDWANAEIYARSVMEIASQMKSIGTPTA